MYTSKEFRNPWLLYKISGNGIYIGQCKSHNELCMAENMQCGRTVGLW
uniref:Uncharacterized protein n=1 Tax=Anguilla anguilla TaxID=7936 RepID=A0A0E9S195_ANGAN